MTKVALITGASGGIGQALVAGYRRGGYRVLAVDHPGRGRVESWPEGVEDCSLDLEAFAQAPASQAHFRSAVLERLAGETLSDFVIINNAAVQILEPLGETRYEGWSRSMAVNSFAPLKMIETFLPELEHTGGRVVNLSSVHARLTKAGFAAYAASKAALESLTRTCALELSARGITVNAVAPAAIATEMLKAGFAQRPEALSELERYHPAGRLGTPEELARFIKALTDGHFGFLSGAVLEFSGGIAGQLHDPA